MIREEFEERIGQRIDPREYSEVIEPVYMFYPTKASTDKDIYATLYKLFGARIFEDMLPRAEEVRSIEDTIRGFQKQIAAHRERLREL